MPKPWPLCPSVNCQAGTHPVCFPARAASAPRAHLELHFLTQTLTLPGAAALHIHARRLSVWSGAPQGQEPYRTQPTVAAQEMCITCNSSQVNLEFRHASHRRKNLKAVGNALGKPTLLLPPPLPPACVMFQTVCQDFLGDLESPNSNHIH